MTFTFIIINYRQKNLTANCVKSISAKVAAAQYEVIVVNNSPEDNLSGLTDGYGFVRVLQNVNKGYAQANNLAAAHARGRYLVFMNADTEILDDFSERFLELFDGREFGAAGLKLVNPDGTFQLSFWKENTFLNEMKNKSDEKKFRHRDIDFIRRIESSHSELCKVDWVTGAAMIVRKDNFDEAGGFDEDFFLFYEDADLCKRLSEKSQDIYYFPYCRVMHLKGENVNESFESETYYFAKESQLIYYRKHNGILQSIMLRAYLAFRFLFSYALTGKDLNKRILKLALGMETEK